MDTVTDRILYCLLFAVVIGLIAASGGASLWLLYGGIARLCGGEFSHGVLLLAGTLVPAGACYALCRSSNDLMDR